jgi:hypothetical protein
MTVVSLGGFKLVTIHAHSVGLSCLKIHSLILNTTLPIHQIHHLPMALLRLLKVGLRLLKVGLRLPKVALLGLLFTILFLLKMILKMLLLSFLILLYDNFLLLEELFLKIRITLTPSFITLLISDLDCSSHRRILKN